MPVARYLSVIHHRIVRRCNRHLDLDDLFDLDDLLNFNHLLNFNGLDDVLLSTSTTISRWTSTVWTTSLSTSTTISRSTSTV